MDGAEDDVLAHMAFPRERWPQLASTNPLERVDGEIKRRANVVGIFPNAGALVRLVGGLLLEQPDEGAAARRCMTLETLAKTGDAALISLSGIPA
jgi:putative transposase